MNSSIESGVGQEQEKMTANQIRESSAITRITTGKVDISIRKRITIVFAVSWMALTMTFSSTAIFSATTEVATEFSTSVNVLGVANAAVLLMMGTTSFFWVPISKFVGRKISYDAAVFVLFAATIGTACSKNLEVFIATRMLSGCAGTYLLVAGQTTLTDIFEPLQRGMATGCLMVGSLFGPAIGPCVGGIVVTFGGWRDIFWIQAGMAGLGLILSVLFVPSIQQSDRKCGKAAFSFRGLALFNPIPAITVLKYPNILLADISCGLLSWLQYCLLVSPRHLINPRFHLDTPLVSGLFYLAPGTGFIIGALLGGNLSDRAVAKGIKKRNGLRVPQDRLNAGLWSFFSIIPISTLIYGWCLEFGAGGLAVPIISGFFCGLGLMFAFAGLNTYCAEALPKQRTDVITTKYLIQYLFAAGGTASVIPSIDGIGIGLTALICVVLILVAGTFILLVARYGSAMQDWTDDHTEHA